MPSQQVRHGRRSAPWAFGILGLSLVACQTQAPAVDLVAAEAAVKQASLAFSNAETSGKTDSALAFMWEDAVMQPPGHVQIQGHDEIRAFYAPVKLEKPPADKAPPRPDFPVHVSTSGDMAMEWGPGTIMVPGPKGPTVVFFKFVTVWEKRGGVWKVRLNSWNDDPAPKAG